MTPRHSSCFSRSGIFAALFILAIPAVARQRAVQPPTSSPQDVLTYHVDNLRTGWFSSETILTTSNVNPKSFGLLQTVVLDGRVDGEPLVVMQQTIAGQGVHNVVYVATENNSVYAIDADEGSILWQRNFGTPVPDAHKSDDNIFPVMGVLGTPVIDRVAGAMYFVSDLFNGKVDAFYLQAISLSTGKQLHKPSWIHFSEELESGAKWNFDPQFHLQRPGLLEANGNLYVAFGSTGDIDPDKSRGMILRYDPTTLTQLNGQVTNRRHRPASPYYLSSIWQSGYAPAADSNGDVYFSTGNSNRYKRSYSAFNWPDSVVHLSGDLSTLVDSFTPHNYFDLDRRDLDLGSGGVLLLPDQPGSIPHLVVAGGKDGRAFLMNRDQMGGYNQTGRDNVLQTVQKGPCWCGPAYFVGSDGFSYILTGGSNGIISWQLQTTPSVQLVEKTSTGPGVVTGLPDGGGTIPVVSSNGTTAGSGIVWFVQRPTTSSDQDPGTPVILYAYAASDLTQQLFSTPAGTWTHAANSNANLVPTVANGKVYVASNKQLQVFGLLSTRAMSHSATVPKSLLPSPPAVIECSPQMNVRDAIKDRSAPVHDFYGTVCEVKGDELHLSLRSGHSIVIDKSPAVAQSRSVLLTPGRPVHVEVTIDAKGIAHAEQISRSHMFLPSTPADR